MRPRHPVPRMNSSMQNQALNPAILKWLPIWIGDIRRETIGQPPEFIGMYLNLMMATWESGGEISDDEAQLCRIAGADQKQWQRHRRALANLFEPRNGTWSHSKIREELTKAANINAKRRVSSKTANDVRWCKSPLGAHNAVAKAIVAKITQDGVAY